MKKLAQIGTAFLSSAALLAPNSVRAIAESDIPKVTPITTSGTTISGIIVTLVTQLLIVAGALAVLFLIIGGVRYVVSAGNEQQVETAKKTIFNAIIGIVVIILAIVILNTVTKLIKG